MSLPEKMISLKSTVREDQTLELALVEAPLPELAAGEVLVRVEASPINPSDMRPLLAMADISQASKSQTEAGFPSVIAPIPDQAFADSAARVGKSLSAGNEAAGVVVGPADSPLLGRTVGIVGGGMYTQYRAINTQQLLPYPEAVLPRDGASWYVNPLTALGMVEYMRLDGHSAIVHTAAASQLGQMLVKICADEGIPLVNIVRRDEHVELLKGLGAQYALNSTSETFDEDLKAAIAETKASIAFDATGGGTLAARILVAMEQGAVAGGAEMNAYGSTVFKQVYLYGGLNFREPLTFTPSWIKAGFNWAFGGFFLGNVLKRVGGERVKELFGRVGAEITTTFKTTYTQEVSLEEMLEPENLQTFATQATGAKFLVNPSK